MESLSLLPVWLIIVIAILALFDSVMKLIALWKAARNNHLAWFICWAIFNTIGILPIVYLVLNTGGDVTQVAATVYSPETGIQLDVYTNEPGVQVYTGNFLDGTVTGKNDAVYAKRNAICLETQKYPDSPNKPDWPSTYLKPGEQYTSRCIYKFSVKE